MSCRTWKAFELDPDQDDTLTVEEMEALSVAAQRRQKRNTLDGITVPRGLEGSEAESSPPRSPASDSGADTRLVHTFPLYTLPHRRYNTRN